MKNLIKAIKYIFYRLVSKKMLITIILGLLCFILFNNSNVFAVSNVPQEVIDVVKQKNGGSDNIVILQHKSTGVYYFPVIRSVANLNRGYNYTYNSRSTYHGIQSPDWKPIDCWTYNTSTGVIKQDNTYVTSYVIMCNKLDEDIKDLNVIYAPYDIYGYYEPTEIFFPAYNPFIAPYILNTQADLTGLMSETIIIDTGSNNINNFDDFNFIISQNQVGSNQSYFVYITNLDQNSPFYKTGGINGDYFEIPISVFKTSLVSGYEVNYSLQWWINGDTSYSYDNIATIYTPDLSEETDIDKINRIIMQNNALLNSKIEEQTKIVQEQNDTAKDTNKFLKDNSFDNNDLNIPIDSTPDMTEGGINNIFMQIYNGFTSGQATNIVVPIPFTGKSFTINSNLTTNVLNSNGFGWLKTIVEAFWWYIISIFIVKDISKKINKIKSGDFENIETNNIKEDML